MKPVCSFRNLLLFTDRGNRNIPASLSKTPLTKWTRKAIRFCSWTVATIRGWFACRQKLWLLGERKNILVFSNRLPQVSVPVRWRHSLRSQIPISGSRASVSPASGLSRYLRRRIARPLITFFPDNDNEPVGTVSADCLPRLLPPSMAFPSLPSTPFCGSSTKDHAGQFCPHLIYTKARGDVR